MTQYVFIVIACFILNAVCEDATLKCPPFEVQENCPTDCYVESKNCPKDDSKGVCDSTEATALNCSDLKPRCVCGFNCKRAANGTCIPAFQCPSIACTRANEEFIACPPACPTDSCAQASPEGDCPFFGFILTVIECQPQCRCKKGYWRKDGVCVPYEECPEDDNRKQ